MSFTINSTNTNTWKRIKTQYVTLAAGAALALSAAVAFGAWEGSSTTTTTVSTSSAPSAVSIAKTSHLPVLTIYLVGSQEQADYVRDMDYAAAYVRAELGVADPPFTSMVLLADSAESLERAQHAIGATYADAAASETFEVTMVDMREP